MSSRRSGVSYIVSVAIMTAVTIALGLFIWGIVGGWAGASAIDIVEETNKGIAQQRSILMIEVVDLERRIVWVSNPGKTELVILSCTVYPKGSRPPERSFQELDRIPASMNEVHPLDSNKCSFPGSSPPTSLVIEIYAISSAVYNPSNPVENIQWAILVRGNA